MTDALVPKLVQPKAVLTGPPRVIAQISWKSVKVNSTEKVITTAMIGVRSG